jgi:hypothetical protein
LDAIEEMERRRRRWIWLREKIRPTGAFFSTRWHRTALGHYASFRCSSTSDQTTGKQAVCASCNDVGDRAAERVKRILFGIANLQDAKSLRDVIGDQLLVGRGFGLLR